MNPDELKPGSLDEYLRTVTPVEREIKRLFRDRTPLVIFDIGACEGEESIRYSRCLPQAKIYSFEPLPANQRLVEINFARFGIQSAELVRVALSDREGTAEFHVSSGTPPVNFAGEDWNYGNKSSSLLPPASGDPMFGWVKFDEKITVKTETLDAFVSERAIGRIDFIHMDVQGAEHMVLAGAKRSLVNTSAVWLETSKVELYRGQRLRNETEDSMRAAGFAKILDLQRDVEGDQFYVNKRHFGLNPYIAFRRLVALLRGRSP